MSKNKPYIKNHTIFYAALVMGYGQAVMAGQETWEMGGASGDKLAPP
jgi:hypothetical protein